MKATFRKRKSAKIDRPMGRSYSRVKWDNVNHNWRSAAIGLFSEFLDILTAEMSVGLKGVQNEPFGDISS